MQGGELSAALAAALVQDTQLVFQQMGLQTLRVSLLKGGSFEAQSSCLIGEQGLVQDADALRPLDSAFPGGAAHLSELMNQPEVFTSVRKLSPRQWQLAWRLEDEQTVMAEAKFHDKRDALSEADTAVLRLVCNNSLRRSRDGAKQNKSDEQSLLVWPQVDRRKAAAPILPAWLPAWLAAVLLGLTVLCCAWLLFFALPQSAQGTQALQGEYNRLRDGTMTRSLSAALATGDYGDVQSALQNCLELAQLESAVVVNDKQRTVAIVGTLKNQRIGEAVVPGYAAGAKALKLATGSQEHGQLLFVPAQSLDSSGPGRAAAWAAGMAMFSSLVLLALLLWRRASSG
jgi:hypothetical protein